MTGQRPSDLLELEAPIYIRLLFDAMVLSQQAEPESLADRIRRKYLRWPSWLKR